MYSRRQVQNPASRVEAPGSSTPESSNPGLSEGAQRIKTHVATTNATTNTQIQIGPECFKPPGLDIKQFQPTESEWTPPRAYDARQAWSGAYPGMPHLPIRVEAASYGGRPVYFEIAAPWSKTSAGGEGPEGTGEKIATWLLMTFFFATMLVASLLALKNLRLGRGDRRGAFRVALFLFVIRMVYWVFTTHHVAEVSELMLLVTGLQSALFWSCFAGLLYLALEPYLRRRWPQRIISWSRLVAGDVRDPLVGRDILIGAVIGSFCVTLMYLRLLLPRWLGLDPGMPDVSDAFSTSMVGSAAFAKLFINQLSAAVVQTFMIVFLLLFLSLLLRKDWAGITVGFLMLASLFVFTVVGQEHPLAFGFVLLSVGLLVFCAVRFGPLALMVTLTVYHLWVFFPITTELTAWYATTFVIDLIVMLGLAVYGFYTSLGGQKLLTGNILAE